MQTSLPGPPGRPGFDAGYGISEGAAGLIDWTELGRQFAESRNYWIASVTPRGMPHTAPVWGVWVDGVLYFSTGRTSRKGRNLAANPAVTVHLESGDDVYLIEGSVEEEHDPLALERFLDAYERKYQMRPDLAALDALVLAVKPRVAF